MSKRYVLFASLPYAYPILRPLQDEILRRGDEVAWYLERGCEDLLSPHESRLKSFQDVFNYKPIAIFAAGNIVYDFFPGVKVNVFHGYPINKRNDKVDDHFHLRGWFDVCCTQGPSSTSTFSSLAERFGYFRVYETGWPKADLLYRLKSLASTDSSHGGHVPTIFVASTFTRGISHLDEFFPVIERISRAKNWNWIVTVHPKYDNKSVCEKFRQLASQQSNVQFLPVINDVSVMATADVLLCDSSSIIIEFLMHDKPVVTYHNTSGGSHVLDVDDVDDIERALESALSRPTELVSSMREYVAYHERFFDGRNSARVLDAVDDFISNHMDAMKRKPRNIFRKLQLRMRLRYFYWKSNR